MDETLRYDISQMSEEENQVLTAPFSEEEVKMAIFDMEHNKAPSPDGLPTELYQFFWEIIKLDLMSLFFEFHATSLPIYSLNFGVLTLLPKVTDAVQIQQYRLICLLNVSFKIFTKVLNNRLLKVAGKLIGPSQMAFILGRYIMEGVVTLHETIHELHRKKQNVVILKLDFGKA
jgi:hypothetical protein